MMDPFTLKVAEKILTINVVRYFLFSGLAFLIFYTILSNTTFLKKKIQDRMPSHSDYWREILYSICTILIFVLVGVSLFGTPLREYTLQYHDISEYGWGYWFLSIILMILLHDSYFYFAHRAMHHPRWFKWFHLVHHKSTNPSPWASYAFHPLEGVVEAAIIYPIAFLIPFHSTAFMSFLLFMMAYNVYGHLGYEIFPKGFNKHPIGKWLNTSVNHNQHHKHFEGNFGLYFLFWDRMLGTLREDYDKAYSIVDDKRSSIK